MNYKQIVRTVLTEWKKSRDDDQILYASVLRRLGFNVKKSSALLLIKAVRAKKLPSLDSITRLRRMVQMNEPSLRGDEYDLRHSKKVQKALNDLGYAATSS